LSYTYLYVLAESLDAVDLVFGDLAIGDLAGGDFAVGDFAFLGDLIGI
jgi:hypothetical protein